MGITVASKGGVAHAGQPLLLEREREIAALGATLDSARTAPGGFVLITGAAGVGKTRLLETARLRAADQGLDVAFARCVPLEQEFSFGVPLALFQRTLMETDDVVRQTLFTGPAQLAEPLFSGSDAGDSPERQLSPLLHGLYWLTSNIAADSPLAILIDDAQWADPASLQFINYLACRIDDLALTLVVAVRDEEPAGERAELLAELAAIESATLLDPRPLSESAVATLVRDHLPNAGDEFCSACATTSAGNPFLLHELLAELIARGVCPDADGARALESMAPEAVRRTTALRLARLGPDAGELAKAVVVLGGDAELSLAANLAGLDVDAATDASEVLTRAGILAGGDRLELAHPLVANAVVTQIGKRSLERAHAQAARRLAAAGAPSEIVAAHLLASQRNGDPWVVETLLDAARAAAARGAPESTQQYLERALVEPAGERKPAVTLALGRAQLLAGAAEASDTLRVAAELHVGDQRAEALHALGTALYRQGRLADAADAFEAGADVDGVKDPELLRRNEAGFFDVAMLARPDDGPTIIARIGAAVKSIGDRQPSAAERAILSMGGLTSAMLGEPREQGVALAERALDDGQLLADEGADGNALYAITGVLSLADRLARSEEVLTDAIEVAQRTGSITGFATASYCRGHPLLGRGAINEAIADERAAIAAQASGWEQYLPAAYAILVMALIERDELDEAAAAVAELDEERWQTQMPWLLFLGSRGQLALARGDAEAALADFEAWGQGWPMPNPAFYGEWRSRAAVAAARLGDRARGVELAREELRLVERYGSPRSTGIALRALGLAVGSEEGIAHLRNAVATLGQSESVLELCRATVDLGAALRRAGQRTDSRDVLRSGLDLSRRLGALALERQAADELRLAGGKPRSRYLSGVESLTPAELRVARMAADGLTNREIAQALFVTAKAIEFHLRNTYRKLEIGSRKEIAATLSDQPRPVTTLVQELRV